MNEYSPRVPITNRDIGDVLKYHAIDADAFNGKAVLDIGCGMSDLRADLSRLDIEAFVVGLEVDRDSLAENQEYSLIPYEPVVGSGSELPFSDESFDIVIATYSLPMWATSENQIRSFFTDAKRVLKPGGILSVYPLAVSSQAINHDDMDTFDLMTLATRLEASSIECDPNWYEIKHDPEGLTALKVE